MHKILLHLHLGCSTAATKVAVFYQQKVVLKLADVAMQTLTDRYGGCFCFPFKREEKCWCNLMGNLSGRWLQMLHFYHGERNGPSVQGFKSNLVRNAKANQVSWSIMILFVNYWLFVAPSSTHISTIWWQATAFTSWYVDIHIQFDKKWTSNVFSLTKWLWSSFGTEIWS